MMSRYYRRTGEDKRSERGRESDPARSCKIADQRQQGHGCACNAGFGQRDWLFGGYSHAGCNRGEWQQERLMKAHMALVAMCAGISQRNRQALNDVG
jgi:hypothetical protein